MSRVDWQQPSLRDSTLACNFESILATVLTYCTVLYYDCLSAHLCPQPWQTPLGRLGHPVLEVDFVTGMGEDESSQVTSVLSIFASHAFH